MLVGGAVIPGCAGRGQQDQGFYQILVAGSPLQDPLQRETAWQKRVTRIRKTRQNADR